MPLLKTGSKMMLGDFISPEGSQSHNRIQSLVFSNIARDIFPASATFLRDALVKSILDGALVSSQTRYSLEAYTVELSLTTAPSPSPVSRYPASTTLDQRLKESLPSHVDQSTFNNSSTWLVIAHSRTSMTPPAPLFKAGSN